MRGLTGRQAHLALLRNVARKVQQHLIGPFRIRQNALKLMGRGVNPVEVKPLRDTAIVLRAGARCIPQHHGPTDRRVAGSSKLTKSIAGIGKTHATMGRARTQHFVIPGEPRNRLRGTA